MRKFSTFILTICMLAMCLFTVSACSKPENPPTHTHDYNFSTYVIEGEKAYKIKRCECDEYQKEQEIVGAIIATPNTLTDIIKNAGENSTIVLTSGNYSTLYFVSKNSYPQNLTIIGTENVVIKGVSISSGIKYENIDSDDKTTLNQDLVDEATLNGNLTFRNVSFSKAVSIKNASIDGFNLYDCTFTNQAGLSVWANIFCDYYGNDTVGGIKITKYREAWCCLRVKNITIENCSFKFVNYYRQDDSAIMLHSVENATIKNCVVNGSMYNALQISGHNYCKTKGTILIESNIFKNTPDRLLRFSYIEEGTTITLKNNDLENTGDYLGEGFLKASSANGAIFEFKGNTYDGEPIDRDSYGILIEE